MSKLFPYAAAMALLIFGVVVGVDAIQGEPVEDEPVPSAASAESVDGPNVLHWAGCGITRTAFMAEMAAAYELQSGVKIVIEGGGATRGIRDTASRKIDMGGSCRLPLGDPAGLRPQPEEAGINMVPVAWDALVVIVHPDNPLDSISLPQLRDLLLGDVTDWSGLGGPTRPIELQIRQGRISGVGHTLRNLLFGDPGQDFTASATVHKSTGPLEKAIEEKPWAVGVTGVSSARKRNVKMLKLAGVEPTYENIKLGRYLLYRPLYLVTPLPSSAQETVDPRIADFVRFATGIEGARVLRSMGTVPYRDAPQLVLRQLQELRKALDGGLLNR